MGPEARVSKLDDLRVLEVKPLIPPQLLAEEIPASESACSTVMKARKEAEAVISGTDDRLLVIVGPCSVHDPKAALEYGKLLKEQMENFKEELVIIMRVYFEKPRTTVGWKGLINDPFLDESFEINKGLRIGRSLLQNLVCFHLAEQPYCT